jgi:type II secretion system protein N
MGPFIKSLFTQHKMKFFMFYVLSAVFFILFFPFGDLSDKITTEVSAATGNSVYVQFDDLSLAMIPQPALKMVNVVAELQQAPELFMTELSVAPSLAAIFKRKPMGRAYAEGLYQGNLDVHVSGSSKIKDDSAISTQVDFTNFNIKDLIKALQKNQNLPLTASGVGQLQAQIDFMPNMKTQPDGDITLGIRQVQIPAFNIPLEAIGGSLPVPGLNLDKLQLKGKIKDGRLFISDTFVGSPKDELYAKVSGDMAVRVAPGASNMDFGAYNLAIDITIREGLQSQLSSYMGLLDGFVGSYKQPAISGTRYAFRVQGRSFQDPAPQFTAL